MIAAATAVGRHPFWHFAVVALVAVAVFVGIKAAEWLKRRRRRQAELAVRPDRPGQSSPRPEPAMLALAAASAGCAAIHAMVCPAHFREATAFGVFFAVAAAGQAAWAVVAVLRPSPRLLTLAAVGNASIVGLWIVTRTVGLPIGPDVWRPEGIGAADALATQLEIGLALGAWWLSLAHRRRPTLHPGRRPAGLPRT
jgi:hypothetical protein